MSFRERCYALLRTVPKGRVVTYKSLAEAMGTRAYRAVGTAMSRNPDIPATPCHRVVNADGGVGQYAGGGSSKKIALLRKEGVVVENNKVNLATYEYNFD